MLEIPDGLDPNEVDCILNDTREEGDLGKRLDVISRRFVGHPYAGGPLGGGPELPEVLRVSLQAFDCVTYIETVLALGFARTTDEFVDTIRRIRYVDGKTDWFHRNHYMTDWARNNVERGFFANLTRGPATDQKTCALATVPGLQSKTATFSYFSRDRLSEVVDMIETGDLIVFVSAKETLDVFHTGLLVKLEQRVILRHATRTAGMVIEQPLTDFVTQNEMAGFVLLRPLCRR